MPATSRVPFPPLEVEIFTFLLRSKRGNLHWFLKYVHISGLHGQISLMTVFYVEERSWTDIYLRGHALNERSRTPFERNLNGWAATNGLERKIHCRWKFPLRVWKKYLFPGSVSDNFQRYTLPGLDTFGGNDGYLCSLNPSARLIFFWILFTVARVLFVARSFTMHWQPEHVHGSLPSFPFRAKSPLILHVSHFPSFQITTRLHDVLAWKLCNM